MTNTTTVRDYVCLMQVERNCFDFSFQNRIFSFCSEQCRDRFERNPHLYIGHAGHPAAKQSGERIMKRRVLKFKDVIPLKNRTVIISTVKNMMGIDDVTINKNLIFITYDLLEVTTQQIEETIKKSGHILGVTWAYKLNLAFIHYYEETLLDNTEYNINSGHHHY